MSSQRSCAIEPLIGQRRLALAAVCLGFFMVLLDGSALNIALPAIGRDVHGGTATLQWVVNLYTIPLAALLLTAGNIADRFGARRLFAWSLAGFTLASFACALSPSVEFLAGFRAVQGITAAGLLPTTLTIITRTYPDPAQRARAITFWGATGGIALVSGPLIGGALTEFLGWRSIFLINIPVGIAALALTLRHVGETSRKLPTPVDVPGQLLAAVTLTSLVAGVIEGGSLGWTHPVPIGLLFAAGIGAILFGVTEIRSPHPMLPMAIFREPAFTASVVNGFAFQFGGYGMQFMLAIYLQDAWKLDAASTGVLFVPFGVCWVFGTIVLNRRMIGNGARRLLWTGATCALAGTIVLLPVGAQDTLPYFLIGTALVGLGCGLFAPSLNAAAMSAVDPRSAGLGSGILNTARQIGTAIGIAVLGVLVTGQLRWGIFVVAACFAAIIVLSLRYLPREGGPGGAISAEIDIVVGCGS